MRYQKEVQDILDEIKEYLFVIEFKQNDIRLETSMFYDELEELFLDLFKVLKTDNFNYYEIYDLLYDISDFLAQYEDYYFKNIGTKDYLTGIRDRVSRFVRHKPPLHPEEDKISVYDLFGFHGEEGKEELQDIKKKTKVKPQLTFSQLFKNPYNQDLDGFKSKLNECNLTDSNNTWRSIDVNGKKILNGDIGKFYN